MEEKTNPQKTREVESSPAMMMCLMRFNEILDSGNVSCGGDYVVFHYKIVCGQGLGVREEECKIDDLLI